MKSVTTLSAILLLCAVGCTKAANPSAVDIEAQRNALAYLRPAGTSALATAIRAVQAQLQQHPTLEGLLRLGQLWVRQARSSHDSGYLSSAGACAELALNLSPQSPRALALQALVAASQHQFAEAKTLALTALERDPNDLLALSTLADAEFELGQVELSIDAVQRMIDFKPGLPSYGRAAHLRWLRGDVDGAKQLMKLAIDSGRDMKDPEPWAYSLVQAANYFLAEGDFVGADDGFKQALALVPQFPPGLAGRGRVALAQKNSGLAVELLSQSFQLAPLVETGWLLADATELSGARDQATVIRDRVYQLGRKTDHFTLALYEATRNEHVDEALMSLTEEIRHRPNVYVCDALAWALYRKGEIEQAQEAIDRAMRWGTPEPRFYFHAGAIALARGQTERGVTLLKQSLSMSPEFDLLGAAEARRLLTLAQTPEQTHATN